MRASARPWLPSVAVTSVRPVPVARAASSAKVRAGGRPRCALIARLTAHDAPSALNAGRPSRSDSSFTATPRTPSRSASAGRPTSGVGR